MEIFPRGTSHPSFEWKSRGVSWRYMDQDKSQNKITIRDLYPHLNEEQLKEAEENLDKYLGVVLKIYDRIRSDPESYARFKALTAARRKARIEQQWSDPA